MKPVALLSLLVALLLMTPARANTPSDDIPMVAISLVGSPYLYGGTSPETGLDCSGFVGYVFRHAAGVTLPRDSLSISEAAQPVELTALQPGDLVFFDTSNRAFSHVGIYLGDDRFVHAASSRTGGVVISNLHDRYWHERFDGARRVVSPDEPAIEEDAF